MGDADSRLSKAILFSNALFAALGLAASIRVHGPRNALSLSILAIGLPAIGELLAVGPLKLLRHRTRPRVAGVPVGILLGWYCVINGSFAVAGRGLAQLPMDENHRRIALPPVAAMVGMSLDLILDPAGLDAGLWEWRVDGAYAKKVEGTNANSGVPAINYVGWLLLISGVISVYERFPKDSHSTDRLPALLLLPYYLAAVAWAIRRRKFRYLLYSIPFPVALAASR